MKVYVARDEDYSLWMYTTKPQKTLTGWQGQNFTALNLKWVSEKASEGDFTALAIRALKPWNEPLEIKLTIETELNF